MRVSIPDQIAAKHGIATTPGRSRWERSGGPLMRSMRSARFHWADITVDSTQCRTALGRVLATLPAIDGTVRICCTSKTERDKTINGHAPGTPEHSELCRAWSVSDQPVKMTARLCATFHPDRETAPQFLDRVAVQIAGPWAATESFRIEDDVFEAAMSTPEFTAEQSQLVEMFDLA
jgi:hypothetical protein